jgi:hypothetical protein
MPERDDEHDHDLMLRHANALIIEALQLLDAVGAHHAAAILDHAVCTLRDFRQADVRALRSVD